MKPELHWFEEGIDRGLQSCWGPPAGGDGDFPVHQLTSSACISFNIYCEQVYASTDGQRIAFVRLVSSSFVEGPYEVWVCDLPTRRIARVDTGTQNFAATTPLLDSIYYITSLNAQDHRLIRFNLKTLERDEVFSFGDCPRANATTISPDERYYCGVKSLHDNLHGLFRVDLRDGTWQFIHEHEDIHNPHLQFEPGRGEWILVQNDHRGERWEESTLYVVDRDGRNERRLPVGKPYTRGIDGHQCWIGTTGKVLLTTEDSRAHGNLYVTAPGEAQPKLLNRGFHFVHVSASADGRFFVADHAKRVFLGSLNTGRVLPFCDPQVSWGSLHYTHPHAYLTPDNRHVIFNSDCTGICQVYAAQIPGGTLEYLEDRP